MRHLLLVAACLALPGVAASQPTIYTDEATYLADLAVLRGSTLHESFEDGAVWADSRNAISNPGSTPSVTSQGLVWTSNYVQNDLATGTVGGSAPDGAYAIYSLPHGMTTDSGLYCDSAEDPDIPIECFQNDGLTVAAPVGGMLYAFGGRIDTANSGKGTFLLDGVDVNANDTDNIDNWQREGDLADGWAFVGVIDPDGFAFVELQELRGKDAQQVLLFADDFIIRASGPACSNGLDDDGDGLIDFDGGESIWGACTGAPGGCPAEVSDPDGDGMANPDPQCVDRPWRTRESKSACGLGFELLALLVPLLGSLRSRAGGR